MATTAREGSTGENISHFTAVRMRVTGQGNLKLKFYSLDDIKSQDLVPLPMQTTTNIQPTRLANFSQQRASLKIGTTEFQEYFRINRVIIFAKEMFTSYPG
jgi:hypothetical protein